MVEFFLAVVDAGSVTGASTRLHVSQPSVSDAIKSLEDNLNVHLFERHRGGMRPTPSGRALIEPARQLLDGLQSTQQLARAITAVATGRIDLSTPSGLVVEPFTGLAAAFNQSYPGIRINLIKPDAIANRVMQQVHERRCDLGLIYHRENVPEMLEAVQLEPMRISLAFPRGRAPTGAVSPDQLATLPLMTLSRATTPRQALESYCRDQGVTPTVAVETNHEGGYIQLVQSGAGVAMLSQASARLAIRLGIEVRALDPPLSLPVVLVHRRDTLSPAARAFVEIARQHRETSPGVGES